jgi:hypothetical protein
MNDARANSPTLEDAVKTLNKSWPVAPAPTGEGWPWRKILFLIALALAAHVALIYFFEAKKQMIPRPVSKVPQLQLASPDDELIALENPTLFARPNPSDFTAAIWSKIPFIAPPDFRYQESPQWLPLNMDNLGATFQQFMQTNTIAGIQLDLKPQPEWAFLALPAGSALPQNSTLKILGALAQRGLLKPVTLPSPPYNDVIPPSRIQVLVAATGEVISAILLPSNNSSEATEHYDPADQRALELARSLSFAPAAQLTLGEIIFNWHTVPVLSTDDSTRP